MSTQVKVDRIPNCDLCGDGTKAKYDASLPALGGTWGNVCKEHFVRLGGSLGLGRGQELILEN